MSSNQKSNKKEDIWLSIIGSIFGWLVLIWIGYWIYDANFATHYAITGLGEFKLGERCSSESGRKNSNFMFFDEIGWRATAKSKKRYLVYYKRIFKSERPGQPLSLEEQMHISRLIHEVEELLVSKYMSLDSRRMQGDFMGKHEQPTLNFLTDPFQKRPENNLVRFCSTYFYAREKDRNLYLCAAPLIRYEEETRYGKTSKKEYMDEVEVTVEVKDTDLELRDKLERNQMKRDAL